MDATLKQRLLGAIVLIGLAIIFVPMFFSGAGPKQASEIASLEIPPPPEREFQTRVMPVDGRTQRAVPTPAPPVVHSEPVTTVETQATLDPPANHANTPLSQPEPAVAVAEPVPVPMPASGVAANSHFYVHLGIYAAIKNAEELVASLKQSGFAAFTEAIEFQEKNALRVRVGPYANRALAESARLKIKEIKSSVPSSVIQIAVSAKTDAPVTAVAADHAGGWAVQLGAFKSEDEANKLRDRLRSASIVAFVDKIDTDAQTLWRVRAGPEADRANVEKLRDSIRDKFKINGMIVTQP